MTPFRVAVDALAIDVNERKLNRVFSSTRRVAFGGDTASWDGAGLTGDWATKPIALYGRNDLSGTPALPHRNGVAG